MSIDKLSKMEKNQLSSIRMCVQEPLDVEKNALDTLKTRSNSEGHFSKLQAAFWTSKLWPKKSNITIGFVGDGIGIPWTDVSDIERALEKSNKKMKIDPLSKKVREMKDNIRAIKTIVKERIMPIVDLKIKFVKKGEKAIVRVGFNPNGGACSLVGTDHAKSTALTTMNFAWLDVGTVIHEFGHMLGLIHEHQNPKGTSIKWNKPEVYKWAMSSQNWDKETIDKNILNKYDVNITNGSNFDKDSIMLYFFPDKMTLDNKGTQQNVRLSTEDVKYINQMYPGSELTPQEFYKEAYGQDIDQDSSGNIIEKISEIVKSKIFIYSIISIVILFVFIFIVRKSGFLSKSKRSINNSGQSNKKSINNSVQSNKRSINNSVQSNKRYG